MSLYLQNDIYYAKEYLSLSIPQFISCSGRSISSYLQSILTSGNICIFISPRLFLHLVKIFCEFFLLQKIEIFTCIRNKWLIMIIRKSKECCENYLFVLLNIFEYTGEIHFSLFCNIFATSAKILAVNPVRG